MRFWERTRERQQTKQKAAATNQLKKKRQQQQQQNNNNKEKNERNEKSNQRKSKRSRRKAFRRPSQRPTEDGHPGDVQGPPAPSQRPIRKKNTCKTRFYWVQPGKTPTKKTTATQENRGKPSKTQ